ncbi:MAG: SDR family oxidoreductase [Propionibacteriaceae bacterium]|jgi:all-trans-retinol dehydrogenase (NAD+)|nr:SDR family oxidoreductase [Propionibacteriaceae bacterium]
MVQAPLKPPSGAGLSLYGARVLITGAGSGIGRLMAKLAAARGAEVIIWDRDGERADQVRQELIAAGHLATAWTVDVTDAAAVAETAAAVGAIDVLINNAGVVGGRPLVEEPEDAIRRTIEVNLTALFWTTKAFLPGMIDRRRGLVVTIASAAGLVGSARMTDYSATKFGAVGFDEALRQELNGSGVKTMVVLPFYINTGMFAGVRSRFPRLLPLLSPERVAVDVIHGIERGARQVLIPRSLRLIYGLRFLPVSWGDRLANWSGINAAMTEFSGRPGDRV